MSEMWKDVIKMPLSARHCQEPRLLLYVCMLVGVCVHSVCIQVAVVSSTDDDMKQRCVGCTRHAGRGSVGSPREDRRH